MNLWTYTVSVPLQAIVVFYGTISVIFDTCCENSCNVTFFTTKIQFQQPNSLPNKKEQGYMSQANPFERVGTQCTKKLTQILLFSPHSNNSLFKHPFFIAFSSDDLLKTDSTSVNHSQLTPPSSTETSAPSPTSTNPVSSTTTTTPLLTSLLLCETLNEDTIKNIPIAISCTQCPTSLYPDVINEVSQKRSGSAGNGSEVNITQLILETVQRLLLKKEHPPSNTSDQRRLSNKMSSNAVVKNTSCPSQHESGENFGITAMNRIEKSQADNEYSPCGGTPSKKERAKGIPPEPNNLIKNILGADNLWDFLLCNGIGAVLTVYTIYKCYIDRKKAKQERGKKLKNNQETSATCSELSTTAARVAAQNRCQELLSELEIKEKERANAVYMAARQRALVRELKTELRAATASRNNSVIQAESLALLEFLEEDMAKCEELLKRTEHELRTAGRSDDDDGYGDDSLETLEELLRLSVGDIQNQQEVMIQAQQKAEETRARCMAEVKELMETHQSVLEEVGANEERLKKVKMELAEKAKSLKRARERLEETEEDLKEREQMLCMSIQLAGGEIEQLEKKLAVCDDGSAPRSSGIKSDVEGSVSIKCDGCGTERSLVAKCDGCGADGSLAIKCDGCGTERSSTIKCDGCSTQRSSISTRRFSIGKCVVSSTPRSSIVKRVDSSIPRSSIVKCDGCSSPRSSIVKCHGCSSPRSSIVKCDGCSTGGSSTVKHVVDSSTPRSSTVKCDGCGSEV